MKETRRQKKVASLIQDALSQPLTEILHEAIPGLITITHVEMTADLKTARVYLSIYAQEKSDNILSLLEKRKGFLRKSVASKTKLKYNPTLIFELDSLSDHEANIDRILQRIKNEDPTNRGHPQ